MNILTKGRNKNMKEFAPNKRKWKWKFSLSLMDSKN